MLPFIVGICFPLIFDSYSVIRSGEEFNKPNIRKIFSAVKKLFNTQAISFHMQNLFSTSLWNGFIIIWQKMSLYFPNSSTSFVPTLIFVSIKPYWHIFFCSFQCFGVPQKFNCRTARGRNSHFLKLVYHSILIIAAVFDTKRKSVGNVSKKVCTTSNLLPFLLKND
jgi:hypothetical protein